MYDLLTDRQRHYQEEFRTFVSEHILPYAPSWEINEQIPTHVLELCKQRGYTGCVVPAEFGGMELDLVEFGLLNEAFGRASASLTGLFTVQSMFTICVSRWGTNAQKEKYLRGIGEGKYIGAFALTEPGAGSNMANITTSFRKSNNKLVLNGVKKWITFSELADFFIVFGTLEGSGPTAVIVERDQPGITITPIRNMMGFRASHLSELVFEDCIVKEENIVGNLGFGLSFVANTGLHFGRISTAWSATGMIRGCLEEPSTHAKYRSIGDKKLSEIGTTRSMITQMGVAMEAAQLLSWQASNLEDLKNPKAYEKALLAKYFASQAAVVSSSNAVQLFGAKGCQDYNLVSHFYRSAKIMELIEGSTQLYEDILGKDFISKYSEQNLKTNHHEEQYC